MDAFLRKEEIDIVCVTDASKEDMVSRLIRSLDAQDPFSCSQSLEVSGVSNVENSSSRFLLLVPSSSQLRINASCRRTSTLFYGAGGYAFTGYIFSDLGPSCEYFAT